MESAELGIQFVNNEKVSEAGVTEEGERGRK